MFPTIPEKLDSLGIVELRSLGAQLREAIKTALEDTENLNSDTWTKVKDAQAARIKVLQEIDRQKALAEVSDDSEDVEPEPAASDESSYEGEDDDAVEEDDDADDADASADEKVEVAAAAKPVKVRTTTGLATTPEPDPASKRIEASVFRSKGGSQNVRRAGEAFENWGEVAAALAESSENIRGNSSEKFVVGQAQGKFEEHMVLSEKPVHNLRMFEQEEILAAMCAPLPPVYDLACMNTNRRPVRNSLPTYRAPRGGVSIYPSPTLQDITTGYGIWDSDDDANPNATKSACQTIACATPVDYRIYGVYRCLTVKNLLAMTFPELVEAYLNRLAAAHARLAETQLLEAMAATADTLVAQELGYNAHVSIITNILNYLALLQEEQRWDVGEMDAWLPRWALFAIKADMVRRRRTDGGFNVVPSDAQVAAMFRDAGVTAHFFMDTPSWATPLPDLQTSGQLGQFPANLEILVAPRGKYAVMDRGELNIGVTGNNLYRDNTSNSRNEFTFFFENFEGIVDTNSCPSHILQLDNICFSGVQIADLVINCQGEDEVGAAS